VVENKCEEKRKNEKRRTTKLRHNSNDKTKKQLTNKKQAPGGKHTA
jgi:hypothetical protein